MPGNDEIPTLLVLIYGSGAAAALQAASPQLLQWAELFERWLAGQAGSRRELVQAWGMLLGPEAEAGGAVMPWEVSRANLEAFAARQEAAGYVLNTVRNQVGRIKRFYRWLEEQGETEVGPGSALGGFKIQATVPAPFEVLSQAEGAALIELVRSHDWVIAKRDYAFLLARLRMGIRSADLEGLRWGQVEEVEGGRRVVLGMGRPAAPLPDEVWQAIEAYLRASGRLSPARRPGAEAFVFAQLRKGMAGTDGVLEEWDESRPLHLTMFRQHIQRYGKIVGIASQKLSPKRLRQAAIVWEVAAGRDDADHMRGFLGECSRKVKSKLLYLARVGRTPAEALETGIAKTQVGELLPPAPGPAALARVEQEDALAKWTRNRWVNVRGYWFSHGFKAQRQPPEEVQQIFSENVSGIDMETRALRVLCRELMDRYTGTHNMDDLMEISHIYPIAAQRIATMVEFQGRDPPGELHSEELEGLVEMRHKQRELDPLLKPFDEAAFREAVIQDALEATPESFVKTWQTVEYLLFEDREETVDPQPEEAQGGPPKQPLEAILPRPMYLPEKMGHGLEEEVASTRLVLRRLFGLAMQARTVKEMVHLVTLYCYACARLMRQLKQHGDAGAVVDEYIVNCYMYSTHLTRIVYGIVPVDEPYVWMKYRKVNRRGHA